MTVAEIKPVQIRPADAGDAEYFVQAVKDYLEWSGEPLTLDESAWAENFVGMLSNPAIQIFVADPGHVAVTLFPSAWNPKEIVAKVFSWWVPGNARKGGTAVALLNAAEKWAKSMGASVLMTDVNANFERLASLYERRGYRKAQTNYVARL